MRNVENRYSEATRPLLTDYKEATKAEFQAMKPGFWSGVWQNVLANFVILIITALVLVVIWSLKASFPQVIGEVFGYDIRVKQEPPQDRP